MSSNAAIATAVSRVHDQESFFKTLLAEQLEWPTGDVSEIGDIAYGWSAEELNAVELDRSLIDGNVWQIQPAEQGQPWGVFILELRNPDALSPRRGMAGVLRKVLSIRSLSRGTSSSGSTTRWKPSKRTWNNTKTSFLLPKPDHSRCRAGRSKL